MTIQLNLIKDALHNLSPDSGASSDYRRGIVVGVTATLMACEGYAFEQAFGAVCRYMPSKYDPKAIPENWEVPTDD